MEVTLYSADEKSVFVNSKAISCREESCGSDIENKWVLILWTPSDWSIRLEEAKKEIASKQQSKADRIDNSEAERVEPKKKKYPKLFGKKIKHKWTLDNGKMSGILA